MIYKNKNNEMKDEDEDDDEEEEEQGKNCGGELFYMLIVYIVFAVCLPPQQVFGQVSKCWMEAQQEDGPKSMSELLIINESPLSN